MDTGISQAGGQNTEWGWEALGLVSAPTYFHVGPRASPAPLLANPLVSLQSGLACKRGGREALIGPYCFTSFDPVAHI